VDGKFKFIAIPLGKYIVHYVVKPEEEKNIIEIEPETTEIEVTGKTVEFKQYLNINKLTIEGSVSDLNNKGIPNVKIFLDGQLQGTTNENGFYVLERIRAGTYTLEGQHEHYIFEALSNLKISLGLKVYENNLIIRECRT
jgi:hypothetical protein